jgi:hypothetical protein
MRFEPKEANYIESRRMKSKDNENKMAFEKNSKHDPIIHFDIPYLYKCFHMVHILIQNILEKGRGKK